MLSKLIPTKIVMEELEKVSKISGVIIDNKPKARGPSSFLYHGVKDNRSYAIKQILLNSSLNEEERASEAKKEQLMASIMKHKNCITSYGYFEQPNSKYIFFEKAINVDMNFLHSLFYEKSLFNYLHIQKNKKSISKYSWLNFMSENFIRFFVSQIVDGLDYLNNMNCVHGDIKLENIMLMLNFKAKLGDFGLTQIVNPYNEYKITGKGTRLYMSPESFDKDALVPAKNAFKLDIFALGVLMHKLLYNEFLTSNTNNVTKEETTNKIDNIWAKGTNYFFEKERPKELTSFEIVLVILKLLEKDVGRRANISEIKKLSWFNINKENLRKLHEMHDNDYLKFLMETQKMDSISYFNNKNEIEDTKLKQKEYFHFKVINNFEKNKNQIKNGKIKIKIIQQPKKIKIINKEN